MNAANAIVVVGIMFLELNAYDGLMDCLKN